MSKEKQIAEMAKVIDKSPWKLEQGFTGCHINSYEIAEYLYNADYRKQDDVAKEIFDEIEKLSHRFMNDKYYIFADMMLDIAELKKKYAEESGNGR